MQNQRGAGLMEILCVMALLLLFGITTYTLVTVGAGSYRRLLEKRDANSDLRIAVGYLSMRVRQYDVSGGVSVGESEQGSYLVLYEDIEGEQYETRIYLHDGQLRELWMASQDEFDPDSGEEIVPLDSCGIQIAENGLLRVEVGYAERTRELELQLRSAAP